jgi:methylenetetrahydrofolate reductase (NADPH)
LIPRLLAATATANFLLQPASLALEIFATRGCAAWRNPTLDTWMMTDTSRIPVSVEFFPPKTPEGVEKLRLVRQQLYTLKPEFCSVTFGAGGSTQEGTFNTVRDILAEGQRAAHISLALAPPQPACVSNSATLKAMGVKRLVALRGDLPSGYGAGGEFHYASDLVAFIRAETGDDFHIEVAAYP